MIWNFFKNLLHRGNDLRPRKSEELEVKCQKSTGNNTETKTFEHLLELTGGFGKFQFLILIALLGPEIPASFVAFAPVFVGKHPDTWICKIVEENETTVIAQKFSQLCDCPGTLMASSHSGSSIVTEWNLFCGSSFVSDFITSIQMMGMLTGSLFSSQFSDWYGRKKTYLGVCLIMALGQSLSAIAPSPIFYAVARFICGAGLSGFMGISTIYPMEFLLPKHRQLSGSVGPWGWGVILLSILAYFVQNWRNFLWISTLPFIFVLISYRYLPESPRWLLRNGRLEETRSVLYQIYQLNHQSKRSKAITNSSSSDGFDNHSAVTARSETEFNISLNLLAEIARQECGGGECEKSRFTYFDFFRNVELRRKTLLLMGIWFSWSCCYFGMSYNIKNIRGSPYLNVSILGLADALGYPCALIINNRVGRRKALISFMSLATIFLVILAGLDLSYGLALSSSVVATLCLFGKFGVAGARSAARCLTGESFSTPIRTMGYGISGITAGIGGIIAPQLAFFGSQFWHPLPFVAFALISITGSALSLLLPETADKSLDTMILSKNAMTTTTIKTEKSSKNLSSV